MTQQNTQPETPQERGEVDAWPELVRAREARHAAILDGIEAELDGIEADLNHAACRPHRWIHDDLHRTPTPWSLSTEGHHVCYFDAAFEAGEIADGHEHPHHDSIVCQPGEGVYSPLSDAAKRANMAHIVKCVNEAPSLAAQATRLRDALEALVAARRHFIIAPATPAGRVVTISLAYDAAREALSGEGGRMKTHEVAPADRARIGCQWSECNKPADVCEHHEWRVNGRDGVSFFYVCVEHARKTRGPS